MEIRRLAHTPTAETGKRRRNLIEPTIAPHRPSRLPIPWAPQVVALARGISPQESGRQLCHSAVAPHVADLLRWLETLTPEDVSLHLQLSPIEVLNSMGPRDMRPGGVLLQLLLRWKSCW